MKDRGTVTADFNNYKKPGLYSFGGGSSVANSPGDVAGILEVVVTSTYVIQRITVYGKTYTRRYNGTIWTDWAAYLVSKDCQIKTYEITITANTLTQITAMDGAGRNWIPVVVGHGTAIKSNAHVTYDGGKWYIIADVAQLYRIDFYKYPISI